MNKYEYKDEELSAKELFTKDERHPSVDYETLKNRLFRGMNSERALSKPMPKTEFDHEGTVVHIDTILALPNRGDGVTDKLIKKRLHQGYSIDDAVRNPYKTKYIIYKGDRYLKSELLKHSDRHETVTLDVFNSRLRAKSIPLDKMLTTPFTAKTYPYKGVLYTVTELFNHPDKPATTTYTMIQKKLDGGSSVKDALTPLDAYLYKDEYLTIRQLFNHPDRHSGITYNSLYKRVKGGKYSIEKCITDRYVGGSGGIRFECNGEQMTIPEMSRLPDTTVSKELIYHRLRLDKKRKWTVEEARKTEKVVKFIDVDKFKNNPNSIFYYYKGKSLNAYSLALLPEAKVDSRTISSRLQGNTGWSIKAAIETPVGLTQGELKSIKDGVSLDEIFKVLKAEKVVEVEIPNLERQRIMAIMAVKQSAASTYATYVELTGNNNDKTECIDTRFALGCF